VLTMFDGGERPRFRSARGPPVLPGAGFETVIPRNVRLTERPVTEAGHASRSQISGAIAISN